MKPRLVILVYRDGLGPIFSSVYFQPAAFLKRQGYDVSMAVFATPGAWLRPRTRRLWNTLIRKVETVLPGKLALIPSPINRFPACTFEMHVLKHWLGRKFGKQPIVLQCEGTMGAIIGQGVRAMRSRTRVVYHCLGPEAAEYIYANKKGNSTRYEPAVESEAMKRDNIQKQAFTGSDAIICISRPMLEFARQHGADLGKCCLIPCHVDYEIFERASGDREVVRKELGVGDKYVVTYSGSVLAWQLPNGVFRVFRAIRSQEPNVHFLALSMHGSSMNRVLDDAGISVDKRTVLSVPYEAVPRYLSAGDVAILGRGLLEGPSLVNHVSSPVKVGEYLACGNPVVLSDGIGDFSALVLEQSIGVAIPFGASDAELCQLLAPLLQTYRADPSRLRQRCKQVAQKHLDVRHYLPTLDKVYRDLEDDMMERE